MTAQSSEPPRGRRLSWTCASPAALPLHRALLTALAVALIGYWLEPSPLKLATGLTPRLSPMDLDYLTTTAFHFDTSSSSSINNEGDGVVRTSICIIVRTFQEHDPLTLLTLISSLVSASQVAHAIKPCIIVVDTDKYKPYYNLPKVVRDINLLLGSNLVRVSPRTFSSVKWQHPGFFEDDYGYLITDYVMEDWSDACELFLITNGDNIYAASFLDETLREINQGNDIVATHWISRYNVTRTWLINSGTNECGPGRTGLYQEFIPKLRRRCIDLGAVVFRSRLLKTGLRFFLDDVREKPRKKWRTLKHQGRDSRFFEALALFDRSNRTGVGNITSSFVREALFLHQ